MFSYRYNFEQSMSSYCPIVHQMRMDSRTRTRIRMSTTILALFYSTVRVQYVRTGVVRYVYRTVPPSRRRTRPLSLFDWRRPSACSSCCCCAYKEPPGVQFSPFPFQLEEFEQLLSLPENRHHAFGGKKLALFTSSAVAWGAQGFPPPAATAAVPIDGGGGAVAGLCGLEQRRLRCPPPPPGPHCARGRRSILQQRLIRRCVSAVSAPNHGRRCCCRRAARCSLLSAATPYQNKPPPGRCRASPHAELRVLVCSLEH